MHYFGLPIPYIHIGLGLWLVDLLSSVVMSVVQVFPSYIMLSLACVFVRVFGLSSLVMWGDHGEDRCCGLSIGWNGGDSWIPSGDVVCYARICEGLNRESKHPRTTCTTTCLVWSGLLTNLEDSSEFVLLDEWDWYGDTYKAARCERSLKVLCCTQYGETLATVKGAWGYSVVPNKGKPMAKQDIRSMVNLCKGM
jgi:hypothetical protein